jgi:hypothetical protein
VNQALVSILTLIFLILSLISLKLKIEIIQPPLLIDAKKTHHNEKSFTTGEINEFKRKNNDIESQTKKKVFFLN